jgi:hypothetical protein
MAEGKNLSPRGCELSLWFVGKGPPELARTEFWPPDRNTALVCDRNCKHAVAPSQRGATSLAPLRWTRAVQAMSLFFLMAHGHASSGRKGTFRFEGSRGTPAASLDQALGKDAYSTWIEDMFGAPGDAQHSHLYSIIERLNPDQKKKSLPFCLELRSDVFLSSKLHVHWNDVEVVAVAQLNQLAEALWSSWKPALPKFVPFVLADDALKALKPEDSPPCWTRWSPPLLHEARLIALADVLECPAPAEAFYLELLPGVLADGTLYREGTDAGFEIIRFSQPDVAQRLIADAATSPGGVLALFYEFTERCPGLTDWLVQTLNQLAESNSDSPCELATLLDELVRDTYFRTWAAKVGRANLKSLPGIFNLDLTDLLRSSRTPKSELRLLPGDRVQLSPRKARPPVKL